MDRVSKNKKSPPKHRRLPKQKPNLVTTTWFSALTKINNAPLIGLIVVFLVIITIGSVIYTKLTSFQKHTYQTSRLNTEKTTKINTTTDKKLDTQTHSDTGNWTLKKIASNKQTTIVSLSKSDSKLVSWGDYIFWVDPAYTENIQVKSLNLKTGEQKIIYDQSKRKQDFPESMNKTHDDYYSIDMVVIDNTLFFSIGAYLNNGVTYYVDLPVIDKINILARFDGWFEKWGGENWFEYGFSDGCGGSSTYALLNLDNKQYIPITTIKSSCIGGEVRVDIDIKRRMLVAGYRPTSGTNTDNGSTYEYVYAVPLDNPGTQVGIISKQDMPAGITSVTYVRDTDKLLLSGETSYLFDLSSKSISKTNSTPPSIPTISSQEETLQTQIQNMQLPSDYKWVQVE